MDDAVGIIDYFGTGSDAGDHSFLSNFYWHDGWTVEHHLGRLLEQVRAECNVATPS